MIWQGFYESRNNSSSQCDMAAHAVFSRQPAWSIWPPLSYDQTFMYMLKVPTSSSHDTCIGSVCDNSADWCSVQKNSYPTRSRRDGLIPEACQKLAWPGAESAASAWSGNSHNLPRPWLPCMLYRMVLSAQCQNITDAYTVLSCHLRRATPHPPSAMSPAPSSP